MRAITPSGPLKATVEVPGSKSITQRALIIAALAKGQSTLLGPLASEDTDYTIKALQAMGIVIDVDREHWRLYGGAGSISTPATEIYLGNNGTATRFLTSVATLGRGIFLINGDQRMTQRPIGPLMSAIRDWGGQIRSINNTDCPPLEIQAAGLAGGSGVLPEGKSSQYLSSLLLVAPYARQAAELRVEGEVLSKPYVTMTLALMKAFGIEVTANSQLNEFKIPQGCYQGREYQIEGDASSASYFWAAAALTGGQVTVTRIPSSSLQGDTALVGILAKMGCKVGYDQGGGISVAAPEQLQGVEVDMGDCPDVVPTLAVVAALAQGRTVIRNIAHLRIKECDRLQVVVHELAKLGVAVKEGPDWMMIEGRGRGHNYHGAEIATHNDHRIAMSFAVAGLVIPGIKIANPDCVAKSFPDFWQRFTQMQARP